MSVLSDMILQEHSKAQSNKIIDWVGTNAERFDELVSLFINGEKLVTQRAGWPLSSIAIMQPDLVSKHLPALISNLRKPKLHKAVKRNTVRLLQEIDVPENLQGQLMDICFRFIEDPVEAVAVKAFSLTILDRMSKDYPEIIPEIKTIVSAQIERQTPAFKVRARKFL